MIPSYVDEIRGYAFADSNITSITIPDLVITIRAYAFSNCNNLTTLTISKNSQLGSIETCAFNRCSKLESIYIPSGVNSIGSSAFSGCSKLKTIRVDSIWASSNMTYQVSPNSSYLSVYATTVYIKNGLSVGSYITSNYTNAGTETIDGTVYRKYTK